MTSTKETRATQHGLNAPDCPFIGRCSCCERRGVADKQPTSTRPAETPGPARIAGTRRMRAGLPTMPEAAS
jgi:hypothetical protein